MPSSCLFICPTSQEHEYPPPATVSRSCKRWIAVLVTERWFTHVRKCLGSTVCCFCRFVDWCSFGERGLPPVRGIMGLPRPCDNDARSAMKVFTACFGRSLSPHPLSVWFAVWKKFSEGTRRMMKHVLVGVKCHQQLNLFRQLPNLFLQREVFLLQDCCGAGSFLFGCLAVLMRRSW